MAKHSLELVFDSYDRADERRREALFALGNGMLLVRACTPEAAADGVHYPGTYRAGCYDRLTSDIEGEKVENESLVNLPNWLSLAFRVKGEAEWFSLDRVAILSYRHTLDFARGTTCRQVRFEDLNGRRSRFREKRIVSMAQPHLAAMRIEITGRQVGHQICARRRGGKCERQEIPAVRQPSPRRRAVESRRS